MKLRYFLKTLGCSLLLAVPALADAVSVDALATGGATMRDNQLREIRDVLRGGRGGYLDIGFNYMPLVTQTPLKSEYGEHDGFAFRHHAAGFGAGEVTKNNHVGFLAWIERSGWDGEDFFLFPHYSSFSAVRSVMTWGFSYTQSAMDLTLAAGMQHQNVEHVGEIYPDENDSLLYSWAHLRWGHTSVQGSFHRTDWRSLRISMDLESREVYGGRKSGPLTYLPNFEVALYNGGEDGDDSVRVSWEQNLLAQRLYGEVSFDFPSREFHSAALKFYPDASRMIGFEATCLRRNVRSGAADLLWGGAVDLLFLRIAYNSSYEYEHLYHAKGTFIAEFKFSLATIDGFLFGRGAPRSAPMETMKLEKKNKDIKKDNNQFRLDQSTGSATKTLEATGVRYEKSQSAGGEK
ncbi:hypothetical protein [Fibrobacter sp. UBA4309]|uniref:hypothetical protein n=1 Tax=Fibrobacter sp. UBA4309 TaxID=1946537 RepID=UPI0025BA0813|nr:hypothetical protein [Fibrobacter sp. UBA4309]